MSKAVGGRFLNFFSRGCPAHTDRGNGLSPVSLVKAPDQDDLLPGETPIHRVKRAAAARRGPAPEPSLSCKRNLKP